MIARDIIVSLYIFRLLKDDRNFGKNMEDDTYGVEWSPWSSTLQGSQYQAWSLRFMVVFFFYDIFK